MKHTKPDPPVPDKKEPLTSAPELKPDKKPTRLDDDAPVEQPKSDTAVLLKDWTPEGDDAMPTNNSLSDVSSEPDELANPETDKAVEEIAAAESDEVLEIEDAVKEAQDNPEEKQSFRKRLIGFLKKPIVHWMIIIIFIGGLLSAIIVPDVRYIVLNTVGVRSSSSLTVLDASTRQPLKNVTVQLGTDQASTDAQGIVRLQKVKLGKQSLVVEKRGFAPIAKTITIGWGSNPLGDMELTPTGTPYRFVITDYLSGKPLAKAELTSGEANTLSDAKGHARLTIGEPSEDDMKITVTLPGFRTDTLTITADTKDEVAVRLVPARKHLFMSKRSGKLDLYSIYADGKQEKLVLAGSGSERQSDIVLVPHPTDGVAAYVSTRGNQANDEGLLLSNLILVDSDSGETVNIIASEQITILGWSGSRLIYLQRALDANDQSSQRYTLASYDYKTAENKQLAHANYFNSAVLFGGQVYYAPNSGVGKESAAAKFYRVNVDGTNNQAMLDQEVWQIIRVGYEELALSVQQQWFTYLKGAQAPAKRSAAPANPQARTYIDDPNGKQSAWVDIRDGKGVLLVYNLGTKTDKVLAEASGLTYPVRWLNATTLVYRVNSATETADYAVSTEGGIPIKLTDVTSSQGLGTLPGLD